MASPGVGGREAELERRLRELEAELEALVAGISHGLAAPLQVVSGFAVMLIDEHAEELPEAARRAMSVMKNGADDASRLLDALSAYSRVCRHELRPVRVEPAELARAALAGLDREPSAEVRIEELPPCRADPQLLQELYGLLLSNALEFSRSREHAVVEVGHANGAYFVRDNGVGFDAADADRPFAIFSHLHSREEYAGAGAGLAVARRIVQRHAGRIWAESRPGEGAIFRFTFGDV